MQSTLSEGGRLGGSEESKRDASISDFRGILYAPWYVYMVSNNARTLYTAR